MTLEQLTQMLELPRPPAQLSERLSELTAQSTDEIYPFRQMLAHIQNMEEVASLSLQNQTLSERILERIRQVAQGAHFDGNLDDFLEKVDTEFSLLIRSLPSPIHLLSEAAKSLSDQFASPDARAAASAHLIQRVHAIEEQVEQLTQRQQALAENYEAHKDEWIADLLIQISRQRELTAIEKLRLSDAVELAPPVQTVPSVRREDWYGDDGR